MQRVTGISIGRGLRCLVKALTNIKFDGDWSAWSGTMLTNAAIFGGQPQYSSLNDPNGRGNVAEWRAFVAASQEEVTHLPLDPLGDCADCGWKQQTRRGSRPAPRYGTLFDPEGENG